MQDVTFHRSEALAESAVYRDTGCSLHPSCLSCPRERCRYDEDKPVIPQSEARRVEALALRAQGLKVIVIAARLGVARRSVTRLLHKE